jgi:hypothetical protein
MERAKRDPQISQITPIGFEQLGDFFLEGLGPIDVPLVTQEMLK